MGHLCQRRRDISGWLIIWWQRIIESVDRQILPEFFCSARALFDGLCLVPAVKLHPDHAPRSLKTHNLAAVTPSGRREYSLC